MNRVLIYIAIVVLCFACKPSDPPSDHDDYEPITPSPPETEIRTDPLLSPRTYAGTINDQGYYPPDNVQVVWKRPGSATVFKTLSRSIPWSGPLRLRRHRHRFLPLKIVAGYFAWLMAIQA